MSRDAFSRLRKEFQRLSKSPPDHIEAAPLESNLLEWHYVITGPKDSPYEGGIYHGKLVFPSQYPYKPPSVMMHTPNGRFKTDTRLCLSMSDFHPETWNPLWSVSSILSGLLSFMLESTPTAGSMESSDAVKREYAARSLETNLKNPTFRKLFPKYIELAARREREAAESVAQPAADDSKEENEVKLSDDPSSNDTTSQTAATASQRRRIPTGTSQNRANPHAGERLINDGQVNQEGGVGRTLDLMGGRIRIKEDAIYDLLVMLALVCTVIFAVIYLIMNRH